MSNLPLMKCGHVAQGTDGNNNPVCVICIGTHPGAREIDPNPPNLAERKAFCSYCQGERPSSVSLPFFEMGRYVKGKRVETEDTYYCGCRGWD